MSTETTRVSSYVRAEGFYDSAGTMYQYASAVNNLISGLIASANYSNVNDLMSGLATGVRGTALTNLVSGLTTGVNASTLINAISGLTVSAGQLNFASGFPASAAYAVSAGTAANATTAVTAAAASYAASAGVVANGIVGSAAYSIRFGATTADDAGSITHGLGTGIAVFVTPRNSGTTAKAVLNTAATGFTVYLLTNLGTAVTGQPIYWIAVGNA